MPFVNAALRQAQHVQVAETEYTNPDNEADKMKIVICVPNTVFNNARLDERFAAHNTDKVNFVHDLKSFVLAHSLEALKRKVESNNTGALVFSLNGIQVELKRGEDFYLTPEEFDKSHQ